MEDSKVVLEDGLLQPLPPEVEVAKYRGQSLSRRNSQKNNLKCYKN